MKNIKLYLKYLGFSFIILLLGLLLISTLYYFDIISSTFTTYFRFIYFLLVIFITSYKLGKITEKNGYLTGIKIGLLYILVFALLGVIVFSPKIHLRVLIYYLIIILTAILGSIIGIQKKN